VLAGLCRWRFIFAKNTVGRSAVFDVLSIMASAVAVALAADASGYRGLVLVALVPLLFVVRRRSPLRAALCGTLWGTCLWVACVVGLGPNLTSSWTALLLMSLAPGVYAGGGAYLTRWIGFSPLVLGVGWMGVEIALEPVGMRMGLLGATLEQGLLAQTVGNALGYVLVAFIVAYINASLVSLFDQVCVVTSGRRASTSPGVRPRVVEPQTLPIHSRLALGPSRPRAPPIRAFSYATNA